VSTSSTKLFFSTYSVYPYALVKNVVAPISAMRGSQTYKELSGAEEKGVYFL